MNEIKKLSELEEEQVNQAISVFVEGFYSLLSSLSKDKEKLHKLFKNSFDYTMAYACLQDGEAVGFLGLADYQKRSIKLNKEIFMEIISGFGKEISYKAVCTEFEKINVVNPQVIHIDYIATSPEHRNKGIGMQLIEFVRDTLGYKHIELEVLSKNLSAKALYDKAGFIVVHVNNNFIIAMRGLGKRLTMKLDVE